MIECLFQDTIDCYPDRMSVGRQSCEELLSTPGIDPQLELWTRRNQTWYADPLCTQGHVSRITFPRRAGWSLFNPSIAANEQGTIKAIVRSSNYSIDDLGHYVIPLGDRGVVMTENYLVDLFDGEDGNFAWSPQRLDDSLVVAAINPFDVYGLEDLRLFFHHGWKVLATARDRSAAGICTQVMMKIKDGTLTGAMQASQGHSHDKNWVPMVHNEGVGFVDRWYPLTVRRGFSPSSGEVDDSPFIARSFRGGSQVIAREDGGLLAVVHESVTMEPYQKIYLHRFVELDASSGGISRVSDPFVFEERQIEFCAGMIEREEDLILSYGVRDAQAHLLRIPTSTVMDMLREPLKGVGI